MKQAQQPVAAASDRTTEVAVDSHAHVMRTDAPLIAGRHSAPERDVSAEDFLAVLDAHGVTHGVLTAPSFYGSDNSLLLQALAAHPARLRGTVIVEPGTAMAALEAMAGQGVVGIRLNWLRRNPLPDVAAPDYQRLFAMVRELGWHVEIYLDSVSLPAVLPSIRRSGVKVVLDHFGSPNEAQGVDGPGFRLVLDALREGDTWVKLSAPYRLHGTDPRPYVEAMVAARGADRLLWASDWPWTQNAEGRSYRQCQDWLSEWLPDAALRRVVLRDTPAALFGIPLLPQGRQP